MLKIASDDLSKDQKSFKALFSGDFYRKYFDENSVSLCVQIPADKNSHNCMFLRLCRLLKHDNQQVFDV